MTLNRRYIPAVALAVASLATAPVLGQLRDRLFDAFPRSFLILLATGFLVVFVSLLGYGLLHIREKRRQRFAWLAVFAALILGQTFLLSRGVPRVDLVEKVHLLQYGTLAFLIYWAARVRQDATAFWLPLVGALVVGTLEEWVQWLAPLRVGEIKDVGLNLLAGLCGLLLGLALIPPNDGAWLRRESLAKSCPLAVAGSMLLVAAFFHVAHLGHRIRDPEIGNFRSWHSPAELAAAARDRKERWHEELPSLREPWGLEDRFVTEAGWHVGHRNTALGQGDNVVAWRENQILERYYSPFLDLPREAGTDGPHRWAPDHRAAIEAGLPRTLPTGYESPVLEKRIYTRLSAPEFWLLALTLLVSLTAFGLRRRSGGEAMDR